jgi:putative membrane protein
MTARSSNSDFTPSAVTRPDPALLRYYLLASIMSGPLFPLVFLSAWFKYRTLRYAFEDDGVSMRWGVLFRHETHVAYRRIQDIHLTRNLFQRWMGLATVHIQTASGSASAEMSIEGVLDPEGLRDWLYARTRGGGESNAEEDAPEAESRDEALALLHEIRDLVRSMAAKEGGAR